MPLSSATWSFSKKLAVSAALLAVVAASCEWGLRAVDFEHPRGVDRQIVWNESRDSELRAGDGLYRFDPVCLWSPRPGAEIPWTDGARINPDGFRGPQLPIERTKGVLRIAAIGGAGTLGVGVRWEDTYGARLVQILGEQGMRAEFLCAGAEDHSIVQGLERWRQVVRVWQPNIVICTLLGARDMQQAPQGRSDIRRIAEMRGSAPRGERPGLRERVRLLHVASWLRDLASGVYWQERDLAFIERRLATHVTELDWPGQRRVPYDEYVAALSELLTEIRADKAVPILLSIPRSPGSAANPVGDVYQNGALTVAGWSDTIVLDGRNVFVRSVAEEDIPSGDLFLGDMAPSECGHLALAQALADEILSRARERR